MGYEGKITERELHKSLLDKIETSGGKVRLVKKSVPVSSATNKVGIGIPGFDKETDSMIVFKNSTYLDESEYTIDEASEFITKTEGNWNESNEEMTFLFIVFKYMLELDPGDTELGLSEEEVLRLINNNLKDIKIKITDENNHFDGETLDKVLDELKNNIGGYGYFVKGSKMETVDAVKTEDGNASLDNFSLKLTCDTSLKKFFEFKIPYDKLPYGRYSVIIRSKSNNKDKDEVILKITLSNSEEPKKVIDIKGTDFTSIDEYCIFYDNFEYNKTNFSDGNIYLKVEGQGDSVILDFDYIQISQILPAVYLP